MSAPIVLSSVAVGLSVISLGWQATSWLWSGPRIKLSCLKSLATSPDGHTFQLLTIKVVNRGRFATTVEGWGLLLPDGSTVVVPQGTSLLPSPHLPHRLEGHSSEKWHMSAEGVRKTCREGGFSVDVVRPFVDVSGTTRKGKRGLPL